MFWHPILLLSVLQSLNAIVNARDSISIANSLSECLALSFVTTETSSSPGFSTDIQPYNLRVAYVPAAVVFPEETAQVAAAVRCAVDFNVTVAARSGGHSYASYGLGGKNGSLVVDLRYFRTVEVDNSTLTARIGSGNRLGNVALGLYEQGGRAIPHGLCPGVGIGGHATHGGFGWTSRLWGLTLDSVVSLETVLANGTVINATADENPDLFWALRGAGSSYGIVTEFGVQTLAAPPSGILFTYSFTNSSASVQGKVDIFMAAQSFTVNDAPAAMAPRVLHIPGTGFVVTGVFWGSRTDFDAAIAPLVANFPSDIVANITEAPWLDCLATFNQQPLDQPVNYTLHDSFYAKSVETPSEFTEAALRSLFEYAESNTISGMLWGVMWDAYGGHDSKISSYSLDDSSFAGRDILFDLQFFSTSVSDPYPDGGVAFMNAAVESLTSAQPETKFKAYPNYVDPEFTAEEAHELYYGEQYPRLLEIKRAVDPNMVFWNPQAIGVES